MGETDTDAADRFDARVRDGRLDESTPGLWRRVWRLPHNVVAISLVSLLNDASSEIIYPMLPAFLALALGASPRAIGVVEGVAESVSSLLKLFSGYFSDKTGRRKGLVVFGYGLASVVRPLLALATNWYQVLAVRFTDRVGKGMRSAPRDAMIADAAPPAERGLAFGFHRAMDHGGAVLGPLIGLGLLWLVAADPRTPSAVDYSTIFLFASVPALFTLSNSTDAFLIRRAQMAGVSTGQGTLLLWSALHLSKVLSSIVGGDLSDRVGRKTLIVAGWLLYAAVYLGFAYVSEPVGAWTLFLVYGVYFGLAEGAEKALVADLVRPEQRGTAYGLYNLAFGITVLPASLLMGALWDWRGPATAFIVSAAIGSTAAVLLALTVHAG